MKRAMFQTNSPGGHTDGQFDPVVSLQQWLWCWSFPLVYTSAVTVIPVQVGYLIPVCLKGST